MADAFYFIRIFQLLLAWCYIYAGIILGMGAANERWRYNVTSPLIGWAHTQNDPCMCIAENNSYWSFPWPHICMQALQSPVFPLLHQGETTESPHLNLEPTALACEKKCLQIHHMMMICCNTRGPTNQLGTEMYFKPNQIFLLETKENIHFSPLHTIWRHSHYRQLWEYHNLYKYF